MNQPWNGRDPSEVTRLLRELRGGAGQAGEAVLPSIYEELRRLAGSFMSSERQNHTLQPTALVHEAFLRLARQDADAWQSRAHFLAVAAIAMRRVLVDHARARHARKRGGGAEPITLVEGIAAAPGAVVDVLALDAALERLAQMDERQGRIVEMRFFGGLSVAEVAQALSISTTTVKRDWQHARAWLRRELSS